MEISEHVSSKLRCGVQQCMHFSHASNESANVCDTNQLLIFIPTIDENFPFIKNFFKLYHFTGHQMVLKFTITLHLLSMHGWFRKVFQYCNRLCPGNGRAKNWTG